MKPPTSFPANALRNMNTKRPSKGPSRRKIRNRFMPRPTLSANLITHRHSVNGSSVKGSSTQRRHCVGAMSAGQCAYQVRAHHGYRLSVRREGSHATPSASASASAATTTLSHTVEKTTAFVRRVTGSSRIARLRALGLHLAQRGMAGDARVMFLRDLMLQTRCFACHTLRKRGRCGGDESGDRKMR
jgi:hypothetical protein